VTLTARFNLLGACTALLALAACLWLGAALAHAPSEFVYLIWPPLALAGMLIRSRGSPEARNRVWHVLLACAAALALAAVADAADLVLELAPGVLTRSMYCLIGWVLLVSAARRAAGRCWNRLVRSERWSFVGSGLSLLAAVAILAPAIMAYMQVHPIKRRPHSNPAKAYELPYEDVVIPTRDGQQLAGWFVPARGSDRAVVLTHGVIDHRAGVLEMIQALHSGGYNVLAFDFRGHGQSSGWTVTYGAREKLDIIAAVDYLQRHKPDSCRRLAGVGWSMGAAALILAAAEDPRLLALHLDAPYASTSDMAWQIGKDMPRWMAWYMYWVGTSLACLESGTNLFLLSPAERVASIAPRPIMIVHGDQDEVIPLEQGRRVFGAAQAPKSFHAVPGAGHCETLQVEGQAYVARMLEFLDTALGGKRPDSESGVADDGIPAP
jgi:alpha-beta hydrolase superfamily lysophospholipase